MKSFKPRHLFAALLAATLPLSTQAAAPKEVRLDYAYYAPTSLVLKQQGLLEKALAPQGIAVKWVFSQGSNRSLEYLNGGSTDFASTAGLAAVLSRANGAPINTVYVASRPEWTALVVPKDSPIQSLADLKGKKVAATKGTDSEEPDTTNFANRHFVSFQELIAVLFTIFMAPSMVTLAASIFCGIV